MDAWLLGCRLPGRLAAWLFGCLAAWLPDCLAAWLPDCLAAVILVYLRDLGIFTMVQGPDLTTRAMHSGLTEYYPDRKYYHHLCSLVLLPDSNWSYY